MTYYTAYTVINSNSEMWKVSEI